MKHIEINIGKACNNKCIFCMSSDPEIWDIKFIDFNILKKKLTDYYEKGYKSVGFLGGDISIYPNVKEIFLYCKQIGYIDIQAITNGMLFDNFKFAEDVVKNGLTRVNISIHSHLDEIENNLTQIPGGLQRKLKAIDNFNYLHKIKLLKSHVSINIVLNKKNLSTIVETILFFYKKKNINDIRINFIWLDNAIINNWNELKISYTEFLPYLKQIIYVSLKYKIRITFDTVPPCIFYVIDKKNYSKIITKFLGEQYDYINEIFWGNHGSSFNWQDKKKDMLKTKFKQCDKCLYNNLCQGVRKNYSKIYGGNEFIPIIK